MTTFTMPAGAVVTSHHTNQDLKNFLNGAKTDKQIQIESCGIPERMKELLNISMKRIPEVSKFIWDSLTPDEQFTCLMTFPDEIERIIGKEE